MPFHVESLLFFFLRLKYSPQIKLKHLISNILLEFGTSFNSILINMMEQSVYVGMLYN